MSSRGSRPPSEQFPMFSVEGKCHWVTEKYGDKMVAGGKAIKRCLNCTRNLEKANCGKVAGREHEIAYQMNQPERSGMDSSPSGITDWDMEIYATGSYKANADWQQIQADKGTVESVKAKVDSFAYQWRA